MLSNGSLLRWGLAINEAKTKYMLWTSRDVRRIDSQITFDRVNEFIYLGYAVTTKNNVNLEITLATWAFE